MSFLAIGAVTRAIAELLAKKMNKPPLMGNTVPKVTTLPPDDERVDETDGVNIFLFRVATAPFAANNEWRGDKSNPIGSRRPPLALTLQYLLTAYAKKSSATFQDDITAHQLLGNAMAILHEYPVLNNIHDSDFDASLDTQFAPELRQSYEKIKISLLPSTVEEFSKIWTGLSKAYRLSVIYEVSLVQIAPITPAELPGPPVQRTSLRVTTIGPPTITSLSPVTGPAGGQVILKGQGFKQPGGRTIVAIGDITLGEPDFLKLTPEEIVLNIPEALASGPQLRLSVTVEGRESAPLFYLVEPWINSLQPIRGITGIPLAIPYEVPPKTPVSMEIDGQVIAAKFDNKLKLVTAIVPDTITSNGSKSVVLLVGSQNPVRSNARLFEVLPLVEDVEVVSKLNPSKTTVTVTGQRLDGQDVSIKYGELLIKKGKNTTPASVSVEIARDLPQGQPVSVIVDGRQSNIIPPSLESIDPSQAPAGAPVTLKGKSLSGKAVVVKFGATNVNLGSQAYASQLVAAVPAKAVPGKIKVKVMVNGKETNELDFQVL